MIGETFLQHSFYDFPFQVFTLSSGFPHEMLRNLSLINRSRKRDKRKEFLMIFSFSDSVFFFGWKKWRETERGARVKWFVWSDAMDGSDDVMGRRGTPTRRVVWVELSWWLGGIRPLRKGYGSYGESWFDKTTLQTFSSHRLEGGRREMYLQLSLGWWDGWMDGWVLLTTYTHTPVSRCSMIKCVLLKPLIFFLVSNTFSHLFYPW